LILRTAFSSCKEYVRINESSDVKIIDCRFHCIQHSPLWIHKNSILLILRTAFSSCKEYVRINESSDVKIISCQFTDMKDCPLTLHNNSILLILHTTFSDCGKALFIDRFSKISIQNCLFQNMNTPLTLTHDSLSFSVSKCAFNNCKNPLSFDRCSNVTIEECSFEGCESGIYINKCFRSLLTRMSFRNCSKAVSIFDESSIISESLSFENCQNGLRCFSNCSLVLTKISSTQSPFLLKHYSTTSISKAIIDELIIEARSNIESNDHFSKFIFRSLLFPIQIQECNIPPLCLLCQNPTNFSRFSECHHSLYCSSCFDSIIKNDRKYGIYYDRLCELCGMSSYEYKEVELPGYSLTDSDLFCLCCHSHHNSQLCNRCHQAVLCRGEVQIR
jgi:hypothetical protein